MLTGWVSAYVDNRGYQAGCNVMFFGAREKPIL